ncbi:MAG: dihydroorotase, partial [Pseudomonadota bacterium]
MHRSTNRVMTETYDLILKNGTVVNHDGIAARTVGVRDGKIASLTVPDSASAAQTIESIV